MDSTLIKMVPVSVVIPCYRCHQTIARAVDSVLQQTSLPSEIILVDDCSKDDGLTVNELNRIKLSNAGPVAIIVLEKSINAGAGEARNSGWEIATQKYVAFLDSDDSWHPEKLAIQVSVMEQSPEHVLSCHASIQRDNESAPAANQGPVSTKEIDRIPLLFKNCIPTRSAMLRREIAQRFPKGARYSEDYHLWLQILYSGERGVLIHSPLAYSYKSDYSQGGLSANLAEMHRGVLNCFSTLHRQSHISLVWFLVASAFETVKYWRRIVISRLHQHD